MGMTTCHSLKYGNSVYFPMTSLSCTEHAISYNVGNTVYNVPLVKNGSGSINVVISNETYRTAQYSPGFNVVAGWCNIRESAFFSSSCFIVTLHPYASIPGWDSVTVPFDNMCFSGAIYWCYGEGGVECNASISSLRAGQASVTSRVKTACGFPAACAWVCISYDAPGGTHRCCIPLGRPTDFGVWCYISSQRSVAFDWC